jgi:hypothetical protein
LHAPGNKAEVMGDQQDRHLEFTRQLIDQVKHLLLRRDIERGCRLIRDQQLRLRSKRHSQHHALLLTAAHLRGIRTKSASRVRDSHTRKKAFHIVG